MPSSHSRHTSSPLSPNPLSNSPRSPKLMHKSTSSSSSHSTESSTPTVKVSSPLNPSSSSTPTRKTSPLPTVDEPTHPASEPSHSGSASPALSGYTRRRGLSSASTVRPESPSHLSSSISRIASNPLPPSSSLEAPVIQSALSTRGRHRTNSFGTRSVSGERDRSLSPLREFVHTWRTVPKGTETPPNGEPTTWWNQHEPVARPWHEQRQKTIPSEQTEAWLRTKEKVAKAAANVLGTASDVAHEALLLSAHVLEFAPIMGLAPAARILLEIWDSLQLVDMNRLSCLRLTERCATILLSIREEIVEAGGQVGEELLLPIERLVEAFVHVHKLLQKQNHRPFLKRYLKRDEIQRHIQGCDASLNDALGMFSLSIQIRILKQVLHAEQQRQADTANLIGRLLHDDSQHAALPSSSAAPLALPEPHNALLLTGPEESGLSSGTSPLTVLSTLQAHQNERDSLHDIADLRQLMRNALQTSSDVEMIGVLQVGRDEMPEAIKTLQRALETEIERENSLEAEEQPVTETTSAGGATEVSAGAAAPSSAPGPKGKDKEVASGEAASDRARSNTVVSASTTSSSLTTSSKSRSRIARDTLDREFMESGIESLRRLSHNATLTLPSWTITRYEVDREEKIGIGFFSDVYKGTWRHRTVAIKVLAETTPRELFIHEVEIWKTLKHPNVLELLGASSASGDPPWFCVSPYLKNGSLVKYVKGMSSLDGVDLLRMIHELAKGMAYLHGKGVLHGDFKAANVLVNDKGHCVISDFGQSEMKSEVYRVSGMNLPHGTLRWQAPELMSGQSELTQEIDVYAFAICCVEILTKGALPWPMADDDAVRHFVLKENMRPELPLMRVWSSQLAEIIHACWNRTPSSRPSFEKIDADVQRLRQKYGADLKESPQPPPQAELEYSLRKSPDMHPILLPILPPDVTASSVLEFGNSPPFTEDSFHSVTSQFPHHPSDDNALLMLKYPESLVAASNPQSPTSRTVSSRASSLFISSESENENENEHEFHHDFEGYESPPPADDRIADIRNERRYRMLLQHEFHPSLTLPLWSPNVVALGAVGFHRKPQGDFVTLFNSFKPQETSGGKAAGVPSLYGYGRVSTGSQRQDKRNVAQRGMDIIQSWITSRSKGDGMYDQNVSRRYTSPLRNGHKTAHLFTESTVYRYVEDLNTPKTWFKANVDCILELYGEEHSIQKEDLYLVIGTLDAADYALFVSHNHPDGQVNFNVFSSPKTGQKWGQFTTDTHLSSSVLGGPVYVEEAPGYLSASKVSTVRNGKWNTVLLARLRFPPDRSEPTSL